MAVDWDEAVLGPLMGVFGEDDQPVYVPAGGAPSFPIDGVFDEAHADVDHDPENPEISTVEPVIGVRLAQFAADPVRTDKVRIKVRGVWKTFKVRDVRPDGHGWAKLMLNLAKDA